jgi:hypothetical protein
MISTAPTCGLTKGGRALRRIDPTTGARVQIEDPETGALVDAIDDRLLQDMQALRDGGTSDTLTFVPSQQFDIRCAVPVFYDQRFTTAFHDELKKPEFEGFTSATLRELVSAGVIEIRGGHGSPSAEERIGEVPYIKVSDLRAGLVNINPTNRVPRLIAQRFWGGPSSGLRAYDLVCPERTSKNIGDFCVLMPGQENVLLTKEMIILRPGPRADFDRFYILWAMTLKVVRDQWKRVVFMQTNREDVGRRYLEIEIPIAPDAETATRVSEPFRSYYLSLAEARTDLATYLQSSGAHHFFVAGADELPAVDLIAVEAEESVDAPEGDAV